MATRAFNNVVHKAGWLTFLHTPGPRGISEWMENLASFLVYSTDLHNRVNIATLGGVKLLTD